MKRSELFHPRVFTDEDWAEGYYKRNAKNIVRTAKRLIAILKKNGFSGGRILDVGSGFGAISIELAKAFPGSKIIGIDLSKPLIELSKELAEKELDWDTPEFVEADVMQIPFEDASFDLLINAYMLHVVENPVKMSNEMRRVCKPEGIIMMTDLRRIALAYLVKKLKTSFTHKEAEEILWQTDLRGANCKKGFFWWDYFLGLS